MDGGTLLAILLVAVILWFGDTILIKLKQYFDKRKKP